MNRTRTLAIGWTRSHEPHGRVTRYHLRTVSNCITSFISGGATKTHAPGWRTPSHMSSSNTFKLKNGGGIAPTIKANYYKMGIANFLRTKNGKDGFTAPSVIIRYE